ncbi:hypothetical protein BDV95DRAFT_610733 [Massariosphaeria phaeospora]|uniref:BTB domain-containing protein n=1 Tax=Massariosphaeria phaeospora TaxID=100035 RepID=A0A7C8M1Q6_9PLEO|nr:hypothetical protein BDV95DRAFT_610733 [Massariosphaeria phaeospora]
MIPCLLASGEYSDLVITCGDDKYNVHKAIVCPRSGSFAAAVRFTVGREAEDNKIDLPENDPAVVKLLVQFLYEGEYEPVPSKAVSAPVPDSPRGSFLSTPRSPPELQKGPHTCQPHARHSFCPTVCAHHECGRDCNFDCNIFYCHFCLGRAAEPDAFEDVNPGNDASAMLIHSQMYVIADHYIVTGLKNLVCKKFSLVCAKWWDSDEFAAAAHHVFTSTLDDDKAAGHR